MRATFHLIRSADDQAEEHRTLRLLAERVHQLRGDRDLHLRPIRDLQGHRTLTGPCVAVHAGEAREHLIGYAFFPQTRAYAGDGAQLDLMDALRALRPDLAHARDAEVFDLDAARAPSGLAASGVRSARREDDGRAA